MDLGRFLIETHVRTGRPLAELAAAHGVHRSWLYKLLARYRAEGDTGLEPRSRRPQRSPTRVADRYEDQVVALRKELTDAGLDAGAETIRYHLLERAGQAPSTSTIWRILKARGFVIPQPHKRPQSSWVRFEADLPNECWQADVTHVRLAEGAEMEILNLIDDHSRLCVASQAMARVRSVDVIRVLHKAAGTWGYPETFLTDNGAVFTATSRGNNWGAMEPELLGLGIRAKHSRPYHPQTCGKIERFHQTLKKHLAKQPATTKKQLQGQLDRFVTYYNERRPHRATGRRPPITAFYARERAHPRGPVIDCAGYRVRHDRIDGGGKLTLRHNGRLHHIGIGRAYARWRVVMLIAGLEIRVLTVDGVQLRRLTLDPGRNYQPSS